MTETLKNPFERDLCGYIDELGYCRFHLKLCSEIKVIDCPATKEFTEMIAKK